MNILHLSNKPMFPSVDGGCVAARQLYEVLAREHKVIHVCLSTEKHPANEDEYKEKLGRDNFLCLSINTRFSLRKFIGDYVSKKNYHVERFYDVTVEQQLMQLIHSQDIQVVIFESIFVLPYLSAIQKQTTIKSILRAHNVEFCIWKSLAEKAPLWKQPLLNFISGQLKQFEAQQLPKVDEIWAISALDVPALAHLHGKNVVHVPFSLDKSTLEANYKKRDFFFIGSMNWAPNREAVNVLLQHIWPNLLKRCPEAKLHLAGSYFPSNITNDPQKRLVVHGRVDDVKEFMCNHGTLIAPIQSGSGVRIKLLEAMALGVPCISSTMGWTGISVLHEQNVLIANEANEFIFEAERCYKDATFREKIGQNAHTFIIEQHSKDTVSHIINERLNNAE